MIFSFFFKTCDSLRKLISSLKESASTLQDAVQAAVAAHKTKTQDMLVFIKAYIAERIQCEDVLTADVSLKYQLETLTRDSS